MKDTRRNWRRDIRRWSNSRSSDRLNSWRNKKKKRKS